MTSCLTVGIQAALEAGGKLSRKETLALASTNLAALLGAEDALKEPELVAYQGGDIFDFASKPVAVLSAGRGVVDLL